MAGMQETGQLRLDPVGRTDIGPFELTPGETVTLGRSTECRVCLPDPGVSRRHATLDHREGQWGVTDLSSRDGTFLNGLRLPPHRPTLTGNDDLLRIGPFTFRVNMGAAASRAMVTTDDALGQGTIVEQVSAGELDSLAQRRLALIIDGAAALHQAANESELARAVVDLVVAGTGFPRAAMLRYAASAEEVDVIACRDGGRDTSEGFTFSRTLLRASAQGQMARLSPTMEHQYGQSIGQLGIASAICAPLLVDSAAVGAIYLDARRGEAPIQPEAVGFCHAVSGLAGLALSSLKRAELQERQKRLDAELKIAQEAQKFLLPDQEGDVGSLRYCARTCPGSAIAGDLFDIFPLGAGKTAICCGDVTGHGVGSALVMTAVLSHLRAALARYSEPAAAINDVNAYIARRSPENILVSLWVGVYDDAEGLLRYVDAGHGHWVVKRSAQPPVPTPKPGGMIVGFDPDFTYQAESLELGPGERIILYTDGIIEQLGSAGEEFGRDRLLGLLAQSESIESDVINSLAALRQFIGESDLADDTTIASVEVVAGA